jgi:RNA polymerase sigma-70 factor (ECF subfamily)
MKEEATLIERILAGEQQAFEVLFYAERARLHQVAYHIIRDHWDAEEVVQDAFARAYRNLNGFRRQCSLPTWLHAIVVNTARNRYWYFRRRFRHATDSFEEAMAVSAPDAPVGSASLELVENFSAWLEELPPSYRAVTAARVLRHQTYEEIATSLGINVGTVKSRLSRARLRLRQRWVHASEVRRPVV